MDFERFSIQGMKGAAGIAPGRGAMGWKRRFLFFFTIFGVAFCISLLYHAMRPIMRLGGMVASGGPYAIAHPAPPWVWVMPVSVMLGMACLFLNLFLAEKDGEVNLMPLAWPALFLSLGWNFLEFAFAPPGGGLAWGWLVCGVLFALMGGAPLLLTFKLMRDKVRARLHKAGGLQSYAFQWLLVAAGIYVAIVFFRSIAS
ncbi:MAG: hypothetical protein JXO51_02485 [Candidatus Aminicenantes bacterium]|nr:hypothetical protein [Candidatus Aminicenantes bacterium]